MKNSKPFYPVVYETVYGRKDTNLQDAKAIQNMSGCFVKVQWDFGKPKQI